MALFELTFIESRDDDPHDDLIVRVGQKLFLCDSYYLLIDMCEKAQDTDKTRRTLRLLLTQWIAAIELLETGATAFLPFGFFDECTLWLRAERENEVIHLASGWSPIEGWKVAPSDISPYIHAVPDWQIETSQISASVSIILEDLRFIRDRESKRPQER